MTSPQGYLQSIRAREMAVAKPKADAAAYRGVALSENVTPVVAFAKIAATMIPEGSAGRGDMSMTDDDTEVGELLNRARTGDDRAAEELVTRFSPHLQRIVRRSLNRKMRTKFDSQDFLQAVWASFFADLRDDLDCQGLEDVAAYLGAMARYKTIDEVRRRLGTLKYAGHDEQTLPDSTDPAVSDEPTASQWAIARESWEQLTDGRTDRSVQIFDLRRQGGSFVEIAEKLGLNERTVRRVVERAERRMERESKGPSTDVAG